MILLRLLRKSKRLRRGINPQRRGEAIPIGLGRETVPTRPGGAVQKEEQKTSEGVVPEAGAGIEGKTEKEGGAVKEVRKRGDIQGETGGLPAEAERGSESGVRRGRPSRRAPLGPELHHILQVHVAHQGLLLGTEFPRVLVGGGLCQSPVIRGGLRVQTKGKSKGRNKKGGRAEGEEKGRYASQSKATSEEASS